jgi:hypothetical protein
MGTARGNCGFLDVSTILSKDSSAGAEQKDDLCRSSDRRNKESKKEVLVATFLLVRARKNVARLARARNLNAGSFLSVIPSNDTVKVVEWP